MANVIHLKGAFQREEYRAAAAITPGHLVELTSTGKVQKHSTEGGYAERAVAVEDVLQGNTITDAYSAADLVSVNLEALGASAQVFLQTGENVSIGDKLISGGDGTLIKNGSEGSATTVRQVVAVALEAKDLTGSGATDTLIDVRFI